MALANFQGPTFSFDALPDGALADLLVTHAQKATAAGRVPCVYLTASWCPANRKFEQALGDPRMQQSLRDVQAATLDIDTWGGQLKQVGIYAGTVPALVVLDGAGRPGKSITGSAWKEDTAENMAPRLGAFFDAARAAKPAPVQAKPASVQPPKQSKWLVAGAIFAAVAGIGIAVYLQVASSNAARKADFEQEQHDRIQKSVQESVRHAVDKH